MHITTPPWQDRATAIGNMREKCGKERTCSSEVMIADRQTHRHTDRHAHHSTLLRYVRQSRKTHVNFFVIRECALGLFHQFNCVQSVDFPRIIQNLYQMTYNSQAILVRTDNKLQGQLLCLMFRGISVQRDTPLASDDVTKIYLLAYLLRRCP